MKRRKNTIVINKFIFICILLSFFCVFLKLAAVVLLPKVDGINLAEFASNRNTVTETLYAKRGTIYDVNGEPLAQSVNSYTVIAYLDSSRTTNESNPQHVVDKEKTASLLSPILNMDEDYILSLLSKDLYQVELGPNGRGITELVKSEIEKLNLPGIDFIASTKRFYKMGRFASYTVGYAKNIDGKITGQMGIEAYFNDELTGTDGYRVYQQDAYGYQIPNTEADLQQPTSGKDIYLTIDNNIQLYAENAVNNIVEDYDIEWVTLSVLDGKTGAVLATTSSPSFNANIMDIELYYNPLTQYVYEPGSTMKIFSFMAAMEEGIYDGDAMYQSGTKPVDGSIIKDFNNVGWGKISYDTGFTYSSNVAATNLALEMGADTLKSYYEKLGFGQKTGITLPSEMAGKVDFKYRTEIATAAFGQGITTTPIQKLQALTFLANDGVVVKPYIVDKIVDSSTGKVIEQAKRTELGRVASSATTNKLIDLMRQVITTKRTDAYVYQPSTVEVIGKTGTAQIAGNGGYLTGTYDYIRSFAGLFPYDDPRYIVYISVKRYHGPISLVGKSVASLIAEIAKYKNIENINDISEVDNSINVSSYLSLDVKEIEEKLKKQKLDPIIIGNGKYIIKQYPINQTIISSSKVFLYTNGTEITMPDITGWSRNEVITFCNLVGLKYTISGYGEVTESSIEEGTVINSQSNLTIKLQEKESNSSVS